VPVIPLAANPLYQSSDADTGRPQTEYADTGRPQTEYAEIEEDSQQSTGLSFVCTELRVDPPLL
jgi:hypothetical protein